MVVRSSADRIVWEKTDSGISLEQKEWRLEEKTEVCNQQQKKLGTGEKHY